MENISVRPTIEAEMRPDWVPPYCHSKHYNLIPVVVKSTHPKFVEGTRLDYGFVQAALRDGYDVVLRQP